MRFQITHLRNGAAPCPSYRVGDPLELGVTIAFDTAAAHVLQVAQAGLSALHEHTRKHRSRDGRAPMFGDLLVLWETGTQLPIGYLRLDGDGIATAPDLNDPASPYDTQPPTLVETERGSVRLIGKSQPDSAWDTPIDLGTPAQARLVALRILARANAVDAANRAAGHWGTGR